MWDLPHLRIQCILKVLVMYEVEADSFASGTGITLFDTTLNLHLTTNIRSRIRTVRRIPQKQDLNSLTMQPKNRLKKPTSKNQKHIPKDDGHPEG